ERHAALADNRIEALREPLQVARQGRHADSPLDATVAVPVAVPVAVQCERHVLADAAREEEGVLGDEAHLAAEPVERQGADVPAGGLAIAGSTTRSSFSRCMAARPRCRIESIQPSAIVGQASW